MANIFINGMNSKTAGGKSILNNYLSILSESDCKDIYYVLTPQINEYKKYSNEYIVIVDIDKLYKKNSLFYIAYNFILPKLINKLKIDIIFNLSDIPIPVKSVKQVFLFDWSYAVYPKSIVWKMMDIKSLIIRKLKLYFFKRYLNYASTIIAQTDTIKNRLVKIYNLKDVKVVPNAVSLENINLPKYYNFELPKGRKLLYLTHYYPHKNIEIFIPLAKIIKKKNLDIKLIITIAGSQHSKAMFFLKQVKHLGLDDIICNIGPVDMKNVPFLYKQCDALLMPTLLESFSGTYVEAMFHKIPIFTSDIDFASGVCKDSAFYFNPFDEEDILKEIEIAFNNKDLLNEKISNGTKVLGNLLTWEESFYKYNNILNNTIQDK